MNRIGGNLSPALLNYERNAMLVLTRKTDERIVIGETTVTVIEIKGDKVRLGITAATDVPIWRGEIVDELGHTPPALGGPKR